MEDKRVSMFLDSFLFVWTIADFLQQIHLMLLHDMEVV